MNRSGGIAAAIAVAASAFGSAAAQTSNGALAGPSVMNLISASDVASMMAELGVATEMQTHESGEAFLVATTAGDARFLFRFFGCEDAAQAARCRNTTVTAALSAAGVTYDDINTFNGTATVTTAFNLTGRQIILFARNIYVLGGHSRELFIGTVYLFLRDVDAFMQRAAATSVGFAPTPDVAAKISGLQVRSVTDDPPRVFGVTDFAPDVAAAIANTRDVKFSVDFESEY